MVDRGRQVVAPKKGLSIKPWQVRIDSRFNGNNRALKKA
jgi:hypothetical protein